MGFFGSRRGLLRYRRKILGLALLFLIYVFDPLLVEFQGFAIKSYFLTSFLGDFLYRNLGFCLPDFFEPRVRRTVTGGGGAGGE